MEMNFLNDREVLNKISFFKSKGFDQIKFPGGTSKDGGHYSGCVVFYFDRNTQKSYFLGLPYNSNFHKIQEDKSRKKEGENPIQTAQRELLEETGLFVELEDCLEMKNTRKVLSGQTPGSVHTKHFFLIEEFSQEIFDFFGSNPIDPETASPIWIETSLMKEVLWKGHYSALKEGVTLLASEKLYFDSLSSIL